MVTSTEMFCLPGSTRRARAPMMRPHDDGADDCSDHGVAPSARPRGAHPVGRRPARTPAATVTLIAATAHALRRGTDAQRVRVTRVVSTGRDRAAAGRRKSAQMCRSRRRASRTRRSGRSRGPPAGTITLAALVVDEVRACPFVERGARRPRDLLGALVGLEHDLAGDVLHADLDLHGGAFLFRWDTRHTQARQRAGDKANERGSPAGTFPAHLGEASRGPARPAPRRAGPPRPWGRRSPGRASAGR